MTTTDVDQSSVPAEATDVVPVPNGDLTPVAGPVPPQVAIGLGWLVADLYASAGAAGAAPSTKGKAAPDHLPTLAQLPPKGRFYVRCAQLQASLDQLAVTGAARDAVTTASNDSPARFQTALAGLHEELLGRFALGAGSELSSYQLGRALHDTCWMPNKGRGPQSFLSQFERHRVATLHAWLAEAGAGLPAGTGPVLARSLQNWQDWADVNAETVRAEWDTLHSTVVASLRTQARAWRQVLVGPTDPSSRPGIGAWVHAGESTLRTARAMTLLALRKFWWVAALILAATGGLLYIALTQSAGTAKAWTSLVTVAAGFGLSGASLKAAAQRTGRGLEQSVLQAAEIEARAWSVTWLPTVPQSSAQRRQLAQRGVDLPASPAHISPTPAVS